MTPVDGAHAEGRGELRRSYHQHLVKVLLELVDVGVCLQVLSVGHHAAEHELVILLHEEAAFEHLLTLAHQLQIKCNRLKHKAAQREHLHPRSVLAACLLDAEQRGLSGGTLLQAQLKALVDDVEENSAQDQEGRPEGREVHVHQVLPRDLLGAEVRIGRAAEGLVARQLGQVVAVEHGVREVCKLGGERDSSRSDYREELLLHVRAQCVTHL